MSGLTYAIHHVSESVGPHPHSRDHPLICLAEGYFVPARCCFVAALMPAVDFLDNSGPAELMQYTAKVHSTVSSNPLDRSERMIGTLLLSPVLLDAVAELRSVFCLAPGVVMVEP